MSKFLTYSEVDLAIQRRMSNEAPDENVRLEAINTALQELHAEFDVETSRREYALSAVPDGTAIDIDTAVADFKRAISLKYTDTTKVADKFNPIDVETFDDHISDGRSIDEYTVYYKDGKLYLKINNARGETTSQNFTLVYHTYYNAKSGGGTFQEEVSANETDQLLMPKRYKSLIVIKALLYCMPIANGIDAEIAMRRLEKEYRIEKDKLDIDIAKKPRTQIKQINLKPLW